MPWEQALQAADLKPRPREGGITGATPDQLLPAFLDCFGCVPRRDTLMDWAHKSGIAFSRNSPLNTALADAKARYSEDGREWPSRCPDDLNVDPAKGAPAATGPTRRKNAWSEEELVRGVALAIDELQPGERLTQRVLLRISTGRPDIPAPGRIHRAELKLDDVIRRAYRYRETGEL